MKKYLFLFIVFQLSASLLFAQNTKEIALIEQKQANYKFQQLNKVQYPGDSRIDVTYYKLNLKIYYSTQKIDGIVTVNGKSTVDSLKTFFLDLQDNLILDSVTTNKHKLTVTHSNNKIQINLVNPLSKGQTFSVNVYYHGTPGSSGFGSFEFSTHNGHPVIWSLSEPYGASDWFPCKDTPADKADSSAVWITADSSFVSVSNGTLEKIINNGNGTKTYEWKNQYPIAQYLISVAMSNYVKFVTYFKYGKSDSMIVTNYLYPEHLNSQTRRQLNRVTDMLKVFSKDFGLYPFIKEKYGQVEFGWSGGMEHQTITSLGTSSSNPYFGRDLVSHELTHQWFGDLITSKDWHNIWLSEGFATYGEALYIEATSGIAGYQSQINDYMRSAKIAKGTVWVQDISSVNSIFNYNRSYAKGAVVLYMLRGIVGDSTFFKILRSYVSDPKLAYGVATTEDFEAVAEKVFGENLDYFFDEWIYGEHYPKYSYDWSITLLSNGSYEVKVDLTQSVNTNPTFFTMPIQLKFHFASGDSLLTVFNNSASQSFSFVFKNKPSQLTFDPDNWILKSVISVTNVYNNVSVKSYFLSQNYPNPFNPATTIEYILKNASNVKLNVYNILGQKVKTLVNKYEPAGKYKVSFDGSNLPSGIYFYDLKAGKFNKVKKMVLLK